MGLIDRLKKNSNIKDTAVLTKSIVTKEKEFIQTDIPLLNLALSGDIDGGLSNGLTVIAGPSRHFKSNYMLKMGKAFQDKFDDGVILFYDSEFGSTDKYFETAGIDPERVLHTPITNIEELKFDIMTQIDNFEKGDRIMIMIDSVGNLASKKEVDDALKENTAADMTRAKQLKSLFRMITPHLTLKEIPMVAINHTYQTQEMFSKAVVSGGCVIEGTKIKLSDGTLKNVEDFNVGEKVITLEGNKEVTHVWNPDTLEVGEPECFEIEFEDGHKVICSDIHKFLINGEWVEAKDLTSGQDCTVYQ
jgi:hypothetical protein